MKRIVAFLLTLLIVFVVSTGAFAKMIFTYGDWNILSNNNEYYVSSYTGSDSAVTVPDRYMGQPISTVLSYAFVGNKSVQSVTFSDGITTLGSNIFLSATSLTAVHLSPSVTDIGAEAFTDTPSLSDVNLSDTMITAVKEKTFLNSGITELELPKTCLTIGEKAFGGCAGLERVLIPASVTDIADNAFIGCSKLTIYCYADSTAHQYALLNHIPFVLLADVEPTVEPTELPTEAIVPILGDADGNGEIDLTDATMIQRYLAELPVEVPLEILMNGDVDGDGELTISDVTFIQRYEAEMDSIYPIGQPIK